MLTGYRVRDVLLRDFRTIPADGTIALAVRMLLDGQCRTFLVMEGDAPVGILTRDAMIKALSEAGEDTPVRDAMDSDLRGLDAAMPLEEAFHLMQQHGKELMPVFSSGTLVGALDPENVSEFVMVMGARTKG